MVFLLSPFDFHTSIHQQPTVNVQRFTDDIAGGRAG
jgi:hypothetical protein